MTISAIAAIPMCYFAVATDAPNPGAVYEHEMAHCWGYRHAGHELHAVMNNTYQAPRPSAYWRNKGAYPSSRLVVYYDTGANVARLYCDGNAYGCQWGGMR